MSSVRVENITKDFGDVIAVKDLSLEIKDGEFLVFLGPSGCGKTTILRIIAGLESPTEGKIYLDERDVTDLRPSERNVAMVFQSYSLYPHMRAYDNIAFPLKIAGKSRDDIDSRVRKTAELLGIEKLLEKRPRELSGGQSQRVAVGRAIVREPSLFLFDEPLSNLDAKLRVQMRSELAHLHSHLGITSIYVTHDQVEAMTLGERIAVLKDGVLHQLGRPMDVYENPANVFVASFLGSPPMNIFDAGSFEFLSEYEDDLTVGIRPDDIELVDSGIKTELDVAEVIGDEIILYLQYNDKQITVKTGSDIDENKLKPGEEFYIKLNEERIYLFDTETGKRVND